MYRKRLYMLILICSFMAVACVLRIAYMQIFCSELAHEAIRKSRILAPVTLPTVRGSILDRGGKVLAMDEPVFYLQANYELIRILDEQFWRGKMLRLMEKGASEEEAKGAVREKHSDDISNMLKIIDVSAKITGVDANEIYENIREINDRIWLTRQVVAWRRKFPDSALIAEYKAKGRSAEASKALEEFATLMPSEYKRLELTLTVDLADMYWNYPLVELKDGEQLLAAQMAFVNIEGITILPEAKRVYPYGTSACQLIGWVGGAQQFENELFEDDRHSRYLTGEVAGRGRGVEEVCEIILRGQRGQVIYSRDQELLDRKETSFGRDVRLSLDIELQRNIERYLSTVHSREERVDEIGAVVIDVASGDILAMVSMPVYDLNEARVKYAENLAAGGEPRKSKAIYETYPPGSVIKPLILLAGLEEGKVTLDEVISCPYSKAPDGWPDCITYRKFDSCHDWKWQNKARNAIKGSCNRYFSVVANRLNSVVLQKWLYMFGFGQEILPGPDFGELTKGLDRTLGTDRNLLQSAGTISSTVLRRAPASFSDMPKLEGSEKRMFGIGQGSCRVTVLHVANMMATIARGGIFKNPMFFLNDAEGLNKNQRDLGISQGNIAIVREGMSAVVNESGGTARKAFEGSDLFSRGLKIFGKTGSTERPYHAWFAGFAEDDEGRAISFAIVVEGGLSGAGDAAPLGEHIIGLCADAGYIGVNTKPVVSVGRVQDN